MFVDQNGVSCFIDQNGVTTFVDQNGILLTCGGAPTKRYRYAAFDVCIALVAALAILATSW